MSIRQRATECLGKHLPDKTHSRICAPSSRWPALRARWREEQENSQLIQTSVTPERICRSRETVRAWLESSPSSVIAKNLEDESASSSFDSFNSSPTGSVDHLSSTARIVKSSSEKVSSPGHIRSRTISPPRRTAQRNAADVSRIDYGGGSFLTLAFKNAQYRGSSSPPAFLYAAEDSKADHRLNTSAEECCSPRSEFSITSEWQFILAAANAAGMSRRDSLGNDSQMEVLNVSDLDLDSAAGGHSDEVRTPLRTRSWDFPPAKRLHDLTSSGYVKNMTDKKSVILDDASGVKPWPSHSGVNFDGNFVGRLSKRNLGAFTDVEEGADQSIARRSK